MNTNTHKENNQMNTVENKIDSLSEKKKRLLQQILASRTTAEVRDEYVQPNNELESRLVSIWEKAFGLKQVGIKDNFFSLGGNSLASIKITALARAESIGILMQDLISHPTVEELAAELASRSVYLSNNEAAITECNTSRKSKEVPLTPLQAGMLYHAKESKEEPLYISQFGCDIAGELDVKYLKLTIGRALEEFPGLRASFTAESLSRNRFVIEEKAKLKFEYIELGHTENHTSSIAELASRELHSEFKLAEPSLMRFVVVRINANLYHCIWTHHHLILDGWSQQIVLARIFELYSAIQNDVAVEPKRFVIPYLEKTSSPEELVKPYWLSYFKDYQPTENVFLNTENNAANQPIRNINGTSHKEFEFRLPIEPNELLGIIDKAGCTTNTIITALFSISATIVNESKNLLFNTIHSGRRSSRFQVIEDGVGNLINCLPVWLEYSESMLFRDFCKYCQARIDVPEHCEQTALSDITQWTGIDGLSDELEFLYVFENFVTYDEVLGRAGVQDLSLSNFSFKVMEHYPLVLVAQQASDSLLFKLKIHSDKTQQVPINQFWRVFKLLVESKVWSEFDLSLEKIIEHTRLLDKQQMLLNHRSQLSKLK
jgi:hypothetical protein